MAKFIMKNKIFDTDTSEVLCKWQKQWETYSIIWGRNIYPYKETTLYRTKKGNYFCVGVFDYGELKAQLLTEKEVKEILMRNNYSKYCELYEPLEEG